VEVALVDLGEVVVAEVTDALGLGGALGRCFAEDLGLDRAFGRKQLWDGV
jgi:hypothetical protein